MTIGRISKIINIEIEEPIKRDFIHSTKEYNNLEEINENVKIKIQSVFDEEMYYFLKMQNSSENISKIHHLDFNLMIKLNKLELESLIQTKNLLTNKEN